MWGGTKESVISTKLSSDDAVPVHCPGKKRRKRGRKEGREEAGGRGGAGGGEVKKERRKETREPILD